MISFTLVILKDSELLQSINDYTSQKISWPAENKVKEYDSNWFSSKVHTDKKLNGIIKTFPLKKCLWENLKDTLSEVESSHALIVKEGNIIDVDLFPDFIFNVIGTDDIVDYSLIGHILDKKERYYNLHNQMFLINVNHWKAVGSPTFDRAKNIELQNVKRSPDNFHNDYTPKSIAKAEGKNTYTNNTAQGSQVISALLENNYKIRPFQDKERNKKTCCYDDVTDQVSSIFNFLDKPTNSSHNIVYVNSTSARPKYFKNENDTIISVASPVNLLSRLKDKYKKINKLIFYDISLPALIWTELFFKNIKDYNYEVEKLFELYSNCGGEKFVLDAHLKFKHYQYSVKEYSKLLEHLSKCNIEYRFGDITRPSIYSKENLKNSNSIGVNFTNVWDYQRNILRKDDFVWFRDEYIPEIKKQYNFEYLD